jgi:protocatechuate 3,4-dioxygenase beta subunit
MPSFAAAFVVVSAIAIAAQTPPPQQQGQQQGQQGQGRGGRQGQGQGQQGAQQGGQGRGGNPNNPARDNTNQTPQPVGTASIGGTIVSTDGRPVRRARVTLAGADSRGLTAATSDEKGHFAFTTLAAGRYTLSASKAGYVNSVYGQKKPGRAGTPIQLADAQHLDDLKLPLAKGGVITGMVLDENNEASARTQVTAWRAEMRTGEKRYQQVGSDQTDDRGIYRIFGLLPGDYIVRATPRDTDDLRSVVQDVVSQLGANGGGGRGGAGGGQGGGQGGRGGGLGGIQLGGGALQQLLGGRGGAAQVLGGLLADPNADDNTGVGYAPVYYPGTTTSTNATAIALDVSQERQGVDFQLQLVQTAKLSGNVTSPDGDSAGILLTLVNEAEQALGGGMNTARVQPDGSFSFTNVAPGQYVLQARQGRRGGGGRGGRGQGGPGGAGPGGVAGAQGPAPQASEVLWGETAVFVDGHPVNGVTITMQPGMKVSGRLVFDGATPPADLTRVRVALAPASPGQGIDLAQNTPASLDATGNFTVTGVAPGRYTIRVQGQIQGTLKSAVTAGRDILDFPLDVKPNRDVADLTLTVGNQTQELSGTLTDAQSMPATAYTVIVFSAETRFWTPQSRRIVPSRPGTDGRYIVRNLPPGDYLVAAVTDVEPGEWFDPKFLEQLRAASARVTIAPNDKKVLDLRLGGGGA